MKIKKLHLLGYKRFKDLTIDLGNDPKRIVALVGANGCGKSSVFDSMLYHIRAYSDGIIGNGNVKDYKYHSLNNDPNYNYNKVLIEFDKGNYDVVLGIKHNLGMGKTIFSFRSSFRYNNSLHVQESRAIKDLKQNNFGASYASAIDQRIEENYRHLNVKYNKYLNDKDCKPSEAKSHIIGELNNSIKKCLNLEIDNLGNIESNQGTIYFRKKDTSEPFEYDVLSSGEKEIVDILLDLYLRQDVYNDSIYIIDEPELHLNTAIQRKLLIEINKIIPDNCQIWIATHSIGFLRALQEELNEDSQVIEFKEENQWASQAYTLTPMIKSRSNWKNLFQTALDDLTELISPKRIVYCEGRADPYPNGSERGLDAKVFNIIFGETYPDTLFVSSGGNTELDKNSAIAIDILSKVFFKLKILVLKDRDMASGKDVSEFDRQLYLKNNHQNHRVLKRFEIENYLYDKEVLKAYCDSESLPFDEITYDSKITDIVNQHLKDITGIVKNCCSIKFSISPENFKLNLAKVITPSMQVYQELEKVIFYRE